MGIMSGMQVKVRCALRKMTARCLNQKKNKEITKKKNTVIVLTDAELHFCLTSTCICTSSYPSQIESNRIVKARTLIPKTQTNTLKFAKGESNLAQLNPAQFSPPSPTRTSPSSPNHHAAIISSLFLLFLRIIFE